MTITNDLVAGGIALSIMGAIIVQMRDLPKLLLQRLRRKFVYTVRCYQNEEIFFWLDTWISENYSEKCKNEEAIVVYGESTCVKYRQEDSMFFIRFQGKRLLIKKSKDKLENASDLRNCYLRHYVIEGWVAEKQIKALIKEALDLGVRRKKSDNVRVFRTSPNGSSIMVGTSRPKPLDKVILSHSTKTRLLGDIKEFKESRQWYYDNNITYKRGYMLYGPPGTGKTTLCLAIAAYLERELVVANLSTLSGDMSLMDMFSNVRNADILVIEDIDSSLDGRQSNGKITFAGLLNAIDGVLQKDDFIMIITTNHPERLDPALIRPGRIDVQIEIPNPGPAEVSEYLSIFYGHTINVDRCLPDLSMAKVQEICVRNRYHQSSAITEITGMETTMCDVVPFEEAAAKHRLSVS